MEKILSTILIVCLMVSFILPSVTVYAVTPVNNSENQFIGFYEDFNDYTGGVPSGWTTSAGDTVTQHWTVIPGPSGREDDKAIAVSGTDASLTYTFPTENNVMDVRSNEYIISFDFMNYSTDPSKTKFSQNTFDLRGTIDHSSYTYSYYDASRTPRIRNGNRVGFVGQNTKNSTTLPDDLKLNTWYRVQTILKVDETTNTMTATGFLEGEYLISNDDPNEPLQYSVTPSGTNSKPKSFTINFKTGSDTACNVAIDNVSILPFEDGKGQISSISAAKSKRGTYVSDTSRYINDFDGNMYKPGDIVTGSYWANGKTNYVNDGTYSMADAGTNSGLSLRYVDTMSKYGASQTIDVYPFKAASESERIQLTEDKYIVTVDWYTESNSTAGSDPLPLLIPSIEVYDTNGKAAKVSMQRINHTAEGINFHNNIKASGYNRIISSSIPKFGTSRWNTIMVKLDKTNNTATHYANGYLLTGWASGDNQTVEVIQSLSDIGTINDFSAISNFLLQTRADNVAQFVDNLKIVPYKADGSVYAANNGVLSKDATTVEVGFSYPIRTTVLNGEYSTGLTSSDITITKYSADDLFMKNGVVIPGATINTVDYKKSICNGMLINLPENINLQEGDRLKVQINNLVDFDGAPFTNNEAIFTVFAGATNTIYPKVVKIEMYDDLDNKITSNEDVSAFVKKIKVYFDKELMGAKTASVVAGETNVFSDAVYDGIEKSLTINLNNPLSRQTEYTVTINNSLFRKPVTFHFVTDSSDIQISNFRVLLDGTEMQDATVPAGGTLGIKFNAKNASSEPKPCVAIIATYDEDNRMLEVNYIPLTIAGGHDGPVVEPALNSIITIQQGNGVDKVKCFLFDGFENIYPYVDAIELD